MTGIPYPKPGSIFWLNFDFIYVVLLIPMVTLGVISSNSEEPENVTRTNSFILKMKIWKDTRGQDLIEYALMAGFVALAAGAIMPGIAVSISTIFSQVASVMTTAASTS